MVYMKSTATWKEFIETTPHCIVVLPASSPADTEEQNKRRANTIAVDARVEGHGVRMVLSSAGEFFVVVGDNESQVVGFARKALREAATGETWFLLRRPESEAVAQESVDRSRKPALFTDSGFALADGRKFVVSALFSPAQNNTALLHSRGYNVGEHICTESQFHGLLRGGDTEGSR
jgi:hypothetical protein